MRIAFNPSGTHIKDGFLKVRLDLIPEPTDKIYVTHYVEHFNEKHKSLGWWVNPCLSHFITIGETTSLQALQTFIGQKLTSATIDDVMVQANYTHLISPYMRDKSVMVKEKPVTNPEILIPAINQRFASISAQLPKGTLEHVEPGSIVVGSSADNRTGYIALCNGSIYYTCIDKNNAANADGTIDTVNYWAETAAAGNSGKAGTFTLGAGTTLTCRDAESLGAMAAGSAQTVTGLTIDIITGDWIGADGRAAAVLTMERHTSGYGGIYYLTGQFCDPTDSESFTLYAGDAISLNGAGTEGGAPPTFTPKMMTVI